MKESNAPREVRNVFLEASNTPPKVRNTTTKEPNTPHKVNNASLQAKTTPHTSQPDPQCYKMLLQVPIGRCDDM